MNNPPEDDDAFVDKLRGLPFAPLPPGWRAEILAVAGSALAPTGLRKGWRLAVAQAGAWLWPHPLAYGGLAAAWVLILGFRFLTPGAAQATVQRPSVAQTSGTPSGPTYSLAANLPGGQMLLLGRRTTVDPSWQ